MTNYTVLGRGGWGKVYGPREDLTWLDSLEEREGYLWTGFKCLDTRSNPAHRKERRGSPPASHPSHSDTPTPRQRSFALFRHTVPRRPFVLERLYCFDWLLFSSLFFLKLCNVMRCTCTTHPPPPPFDPFPLFELLHDCKLINY